MTSTEEYEFDEDTGKLVQSILNQFGFNEEVIKAAKQLEKKLARYNVKESNLMEFLTKVENQATQVKNTWNENCPPEERVNGGNKRQVPDCSDSEEPENKRMKAGPSADLDVKPDVPTESDYKPLVIVSHEDSSLNGLESKPINSMDMKMIYVVKPEQVLNDGVPAADEGSKEPTAVSPRLATVLSQSIDQIREPTAAVTEAEQAGTNQEPGATAATGAADQTVIITIQNNNKKAPPTVPKAVARKSFPKVVRTIITDSPVEIVSRRKSTSSVTSMPESEDSRSSIGSQAKLLPVPLYRELQLEEKVLFMEVDELKPWVEATFMGKKTAASSAEPKYTVRLANGKPRTMDLKCMAYSTPSQIQLPLGTRIIAQYKEEVKGTNNIPSFYAGIVAETPSDGNKQRYLIFFDDGCAEYCPNQQVLLVCDSSQKVWRDVHKESRDFVSNYLKKMATGKPFKKIQLRVNQEVKTELQGEWLPGRVLEVDASMARIQFPKGGGEDGRKEHAEWIYRGSTRFWPLYNDQPSDEDPTPIKNKRGAGRPKKSPKNTPIAQFIKK